MVILFLPFSRLLTICRETPSFSPSSEALHPAQVRIRDRYFCKRVTLISKRSPPYTTYDIASHVVCQL
nr:MAG TPA: hypothetical protein [Caudoviricetes sp.]